MEILIVVLVVFVVLAFFTVYGSLSWGYVVYVTYDWFVLSIVPIAPHLNYLECVGFYLFVRIFTHNSPTIMKEEYVDKSEGMLKFFLAPWIVLLVAWFIHITLF